MNEREFLLENYHENDLSKNKIIQIIIGVIFSMIIIGITILILTGIQGNYLLISPAVNSTGKLECKWFNIGCQKYNCIIDCQEINKNAGERICVC